MLLNRPTPATGLSHCGDVRPLLIRQHRLWLPRQVQRRLTMRQQPAVVIYARPANVPRRIPNTSTPAMGGDVHVPHVPRVITARAAQTAPAAALPQPPVIDHLTDAQLGGVRRGVSCRSGQRVTGTVEVHRVT